MVKLHISNIMIADDIFSENAIKILQGQMLESQLLKLAEGLNLELRRTAEIQYLK